MPKNLMMTWPQIVVLLFIAATIIAVPDPGAGRSVLAGSLVVIVAVGIAFKLHSRRRDDDEDKSPTA